MLELNIDGSDGDGIVMGVQLFVFVNLCVLEQVMQVDSAMLL